MQCAVTSGWRGVERLGGVPSTQPWSAPTPKLMGKLLPTLSPPSAWDHEVGRTWSFAFVECEFGPSTSRFQECLPDGLYRYDIIGVSFLFQQGDRTTPIRDQELAALLGIEPGERLPLTEYAARRGSISD